MNQLDATMIYWSIVASSWFICITLPNWWCTVKQKSRHTLCCSVWRDWERPWFSVI